MPPVADTSSEVAAIVRDRIMKLSGAERFVIGARMFESARAIALASLPENTSEPERKRMLYERFYGESLPTVREDSGNSTACPSWPGGEGSETLSRRLGGQKD